MFRVHATVVMILFLAAQTAQAQPTPQAQPDSSAQLAEAKSALAEKLSSLAKLVKELSGGAATVEEAAPALPEISPATSVAEVSPGVKPVLVSLRQDSVFFSVKVRFAEADTLVESRSIEDAIEAPEPPVPTSAPQPANDSPVNAPLNLSVIGLVVLPTRRRSTSFPVGGSKVFDPQFVGFMSAQRIAAALDVRSTRRALKRCGTRCKEGNIFQKPFVNGDLSAHLYGQIFATGFDAYAAWLKHKGKKTWWVPYAINAGLHIVATGLNSRH